MECKRVFSIFGATGDLANRKLLPAFYFLEKERQLKENFKIMCIARRERTDGQFRSEAADSIKRFSRIKVDDETLKRLLSRIHYVQLEFTNGEDYRRLKSSMERFLSSKCKDSERVFYLAVPPQFFGTIVQNLRKFGLAERKKSIQSYSRVMFEKPFGYDLKSAKELNRSVSSVFDESQIYRIDHYMAKELVRNLLVLRFANSIFEPLWNKEYIDHVQITVAETLGVENRGDYYDKFVALRDVMQNHMMHLLSLVAMREPKSFDGNRIKDEKTRVLKEIRRFSKGNARKYAVMGQYAAGVVDDQRVISYTEEPEVDRNSKTETYAAFKLEVSNRMWKNVPFYLRTGKRMKDRATEIVIVYKDVPFKLFKNSSPQKNMLKIRVQPYEGITLQFNAKVPGKKLIIEDVEMDFCHECKFGPNSPEAYERLLYDVMIGDQTLFTRWDEVENAWKIIDVLLSAFRNAEPVKYQAGTWGPREADALIERDGRRWVEPKRPAYADQLEKEE